MRKTVFLLILERMPIESNQIVNVFEYDKVLKLKLVKKTKCKWPLRKEAQQTLAALGSEGTAAVAWFFEGLFAPSDEVGCDNDGGGSLPGGLAFSGTLRGFSFCRAVYNGIKQKTIFHRLIARSVLQTNQQMYSEWLQFQNTSHVSSLFFWRGFSVLLQISMRSQLRPQPSVS